MSAVLHEAFEDFHANLLRSNVKGSHSVVVQGVDERCVLLQKVLKGSEVIRLRERK